MNSVTIVNLSYKVSRGYLNIVHLLTYLIALHFVVCIKAGIFLRSGNPT